MGYGSDGVRSVADREILQDQGKSSSSKRSEKVIRLDVLTNKIFRAQVCD